MTQSHFPDAANQERSLAQEGAAVSLPKSASSTLVGFCGFVVFFLALFGARYIYQIRPTIYMPVLALFVTLVTTAGFLLPDILVEKVHLRLRSDPHRALSPSWPRTWTKFFGLLGSLGFVAFLYWLFVEYHGSYYNYYYYFLMLILPPWLLLAIPYIRYVDSRMDEPKDGLWHMGRLLLFQWQDVERAPVRQHLLGWLVKGFFLPLMFKFMCDNLAKFVAVDFGTLHGFSVVFGFVTNLAYLTDVGIAVCGYLFAMKLLDSHIRSTEPTFLGWAVALICYEPFWGRIGNYYLAYGAITWVDWLRGKPILYSIWGSMILSLLAVYVLATVVFGIRFSNLTHRGIMTHGPYRWTKHPAYICKNLSWWLVSVPFLMWGSVSDTLRHTLLLLVLNGIYYMRAKTEERHLLRDPVYVQYAAWIKQNGLFAILRRPLKKAARRILLVMAEGEKA